MVDLLRDIKYENGFYVIKERQPWTRIQMTLTKWGETRMKTSQSKTSREDTYENDTSNGRALSFNERGGAAVRYVTVPTEGDQCGAEGGPPGEQGPEYTRVKFVDRRPDYLESQPPYCAEQVRDLGVLFSAEARIPTRVSRLSQSLRAEGGQREVVPMSEEANWEPAIRSAIRYVPRQRFNWRLAGALLIMAIWGVVVGLVCGWWLWAR